MGTELAESRRYGHIIEELSLFSSQRRRALLAVLNGTTTQISLSTISESLSDTEENIEALLHHVDLPKFAEAGLIEYYSHRHVVEVNPPLSTVHDRLSELESRVK